MSIASDRGYKFTPREKLALHSYGGHTLDYYSMDELDAIESHLYDNCKKFYEWMVSADQVQRQVWREWMNLLTVLNEAVAREIRRFAQTRIPCPNCGSTMLDCSTDWVKCPKCKWKSDFRTWGPRE